jgi:hypothetical protein
MATDQNSRMHAWLGGEQCLPWLMAQARRIAAKVEGLRLPESVWPYPPLAGLPEEQAQALLQEVAHDFWLYLRTRTDPASSCRDLPPEIVAGDRAHLAASYLRTAYLRRLLSHARRKDAGLYRHLYRRLREVLAAEPDISLRTHQGLLLYGLQACPEQVLSLDGLVAEPYAGWPSPLALVPQKDLLAFRGGDLARLARHFWQEAAARLGAACLLPVRELAAFLNQHYDCLRPPESVSWTEDLPSPPGGLAAAADGSGLRALAARQITAWPPTRRRVFSLALEGEGSTLAEIAAGAHLSGPSHAKYHLAAACRDLGEFCQGWPGALPSFEDRAFWLEYLHCVAEACKKSLPGREEEQDSPAANPSKDDAT